MSGQEMRTLVEEARASLDVDASDVSVDWKNVEAKLFARVEREAQVRRAHATYDGGRIGRWAAGMLAAAAAAALFVGQPSRRTLQGDSRSLPSRGDVGTGDGLRGLGTGGMLTATDVGAEVRIEGIGVDAKGDRLAPGTLLATGDALEARGGSATFERGHTSEPGSTHWLLEKGARVRVARADGTLVLALEHGAVEAQVTPVPRGEALAVDVGRTRIAVHGTHLRVQRDGSKVVVDLSEGVVLIGDAPRSGETLGTLVTAPAHVEFDAEGASEANGLAGALEVSHLPARVRAAKALGSVAESLVNVAPAVVRPPRSAFSPPAAAPSAAPAAARGEDASVRAAVLAPGANAAHTAKHEDLKPSDAIVRAVQRCAEAHVADHPGVVVTVSSHLELRVGNDGRVTNARFAPPLAPELQSCASPVIYDVRFGKPGVVTVPLDFRR